MADLREGKVAGPAEQREVAGADDVDGATDRGATDDGRVVERVVPTVADHGRGVVPASAGNRDIAARAGSNAAVDNDAGRDQCRAEAAAANADLRGAAESGATRHQ